MATLANRVRVQSLATGRRIFALTEVERRARRRGLLVLAAFIREAIAHERETLEKEQAWQSARRDSRGNAEAASADSDGDRSITGMHVHLTNYRRNLRAGHRLRPVIDRLLRTYYPDGASPITTQNWPEQLATMETMLKRIDTQDRADFEALGMTLMLEEFRAAVAAFRTALHASKDRSITFDEVRAAREQGVELLRACVARIAGEFWDSRNPAHVEARNDLFEPIQVQEDAVSALRRRRIHRLIDVDPDTGVELPDDGLAPELDLDEEPAEA